MNSGTQRVLRRLMGAVCVTFCCFSCALAQGPKQQHARLSLISERTALTPGSSEWIGLRFELEPGWHIYWTNPGDSGEPPKVTWRLPNGIQAGDLQFPAPQRIKDHSLIDYGYQDKVVLLSRLTVAASGMSNKADIAADVRYLVCREVCIPGKEHLSVTLPVGENAQISPDESTIQDTRVRLPQSLPAGVRISGAFEGDFLVVTVTSKRLDFHPIRGFLPGDASIVDNSAAPIVEAWKDGTRIKLKKSEQLDHPISQLRGVLITSDKAYNVTIPIKSQATSSRKTSTRSTS
jgi:DsbC/DsbD-like thiol-disulfide interchange protein